MLLILPVEQCVGGNMSLWPQVILEFLLSLHQPNSLQIRSLASSAVTDYHVRWRYTLSVYAITPQLSR